jgi:isopentenyldiphosphate isomerase
MKIPIVDEKDNIIEYKERKEKDINDIFRIIHVWVFNKNKEFLIAKRHSSKEVSPNKWSQAVGGTVEEGETYQSNATKEVEEELGVKNVSLKPFRKLYYENSNGKRFCYIYIALIDIPVNSFVLQKEEVSEVRWINIDELSHWYNKSPDDFIPSMGQTIELIKEYQNENQN